MPWQFHPPPGHYSSVWRHRSPLFFLDRLTLCILGSPFPRNSYTVTWHAGFESDHRVVPTQTRVLPNFKCNLLTPSLPEYQTPAVRAMIHNAKISQHTPAQVRVRTNERIISTPSSFSLDTTQSAELSNSSLHETSSQNSNALRFVADPQTITLQTCPCR